MAWFHGISLALLATTWLFAWRIGCRWAHGCGVTERADRWALACIPPTAGLICSVHLIALASMATGRGWLNPESVATVFILMALAGAKGVRHLLCEAPAGPFGQKVPDPFFRWRLGRWWLPVLMVAGMYAAFLIDALTRYPTGYDGLNYHLPNAVRWMQQRSMNLITGLFHESLPENGMIVPCLLAFAKLECLFSVAHLPHGILVAVVIYALARAAGGSRKAAVVCACITMSIPIVVFQSFSSYIDLHAAASWLTSLLALTWAGRAAHLEQRRGLLILAGLSAGVALGSKSTYLLLVPLLGMIVPAAEWIRPHVAPDDRRTPFRNAAIFGVAALACSAFWFIRGTAQAGNPVYPLTFQINGRKVLPGFLHGGASERRVSFDRSAGEKLHHWSDYPWREPKYGTGYRYGVDNGVGAAYAAFVPLGLLAAIPFSVAARSRDPAAKWRLVFLLLTGCGGLLLVTVFGEHLRFVLPLLLVSVPVAAALIDRLITRFPAPTLVTLTAALTVTAAVAALKPAHAFAGRARDGISSRDQFYEGIPALIDDLPPGTRIVSLGPKTLNYPLLGRSLSNVVIGPAQWDLWLGGGPMSTQTLRERAIDYVFVRAPWPEDWPDDLPVQLVFDNTGTRAVPTTPLARLYRVLGPGEATVALTSANPS